MLSRNSTLLSSPQPDLPPLQHPSTLALRRLTNQNTAPDGYVSPREVEKQRQVAAGTPTPPLRAKIQHRAANSISTPTSLSLAPLQEYHSGFSDVEVGSPFTPNQHRRQQSFPNLLPLSLRSRTPSPTRKLSFLSEQMPFTGDGRASGGKLDSPKGGFAGWLSGTAAGSALGISSSPAMPPSAPSRGASAIDSQGVSTAENTPTKLRRSTSSAFDSTTPKSAVTATASRFMSAISSRFNQGNNASNGPLDDELCDLDVEVALFPPTSPLGDRDAFSPAAFKNLQTNAVGLLTRMQTAYREQTVAMREMQAERAAQRDEFEEAETRVQHLKMQLEGMARKAQEQEQIMRQLMDELSSEKRARAEDERRFMAAAAGDKSPVIMSEGGSMVSEDLGVDEDRLRLRLQKRNWRKSSGSMGNGLVDDTDEESAESESVFSRCRSPPPLSPLGNEVHGNYNNTLIEHARNASSLAPPRQQQQRSSGGGGSGGVSALQKIIRGISGENDSTETTTDCDNCKGQEASVAWDTVSLLRDENKHLKQRVGQLEVAVEGALDLVNGIGL